ncbi:CAP domain-containing protein [Demequina sp. SYSU T00192]|uniref:CAP domain-containing protein n=1 Tax=Demequina litoralis TaxID=3051660 RepID=A0ABT8GBL1_9MICO|nr:CAP domain-containing protein [Demequina sp. SYSU T00192]MDN4476518.1 CAP domain-containing protein [Demequina sp. SYSU T00192]
MRPSALAVPHPLARRVALALVGLLVAALALTGGSAHAATDPAQLILKKTNAYRANEGLKPLSLQGGIVDVSETWSKRMRSTSNLSHNPSFASQIPSTATRAAENVGYACGYGGAAANASAVMSAWLKSAGHEANISGSYSDIGIGVAYDKSTDCVWATQNFAQYSKFSTKPRPKIAGTKKVGSVLTARIGSWSPSPSSVTYRWFRDGKRIDGATGRKYTVTRADRGHNIRVKVIAKRSGYLTTARTSTVVSIPKAFTSAPRPTVSGTATVGSQLTAQAGSWSPTPDSVSYRWFRDGNKIADAAGRRYTVRNADRGHTIKARVIAKRSGFFTTTRWSTGISVS